MHRILIQLFLFLTSFLLVQVSQANTIKVGAVQYVMQGNLDKTRFLDKVSAILNIANTQGTKLLVFPEWVVLDLWPSQTKASERDILQAIGKTVNEDYMKLLVHYARKHKMVIIGGSIPLIENEKLYNAAPVILEDGSLSFYRKIHLTKWERDRKLNRGYEVKTFKSQYATFAVLICYDVEFPDISLELVSQRPEIIVVPSMTESPAGVDRVLWSIQARVVEHTAYAMLAVTNGSVSKNWHHFGRAAILSPRLPGLLKDMAFSTTQGANIVFQDIDLSQLRRKRAHSSWQPALDLRLRRK